MSACSPGRRWVEALWPFVRAELPSAPATVIEIGCGPLGGFVLDLLEVGYEAIGIDPKAPDGPGYRSSDFEQYEPAAPVDAIVASRSLHHVADLDDVLHRTGNALRPGGVLVVIEGAWERTMPPPRAGASRASTTPPEPSRAGCTGAGTSGSARAWPGRTRSRPGRRAITCTAATASSARSMRASSAGRAATAPTSSPICPAPPSATSGPPSTRARSARTASATSAGGRENRLPAPAWRGQPGSSGQASAFCLSASYSACVMAPLSSSALAFSISAAEPPDPAALWT